MCITNEDPSLNLVFNHLEKMQSYTGTNCILKKHEEFKQCLLLTDGSILKLFNPSEKLKLRVNTSLIKSCLKQSLQQNRSVVTMSELLKYHKQIISATGAGSSTVKLNLLSRIYQGVDPSYHHLLTDYYTKTLFKIGYSLATVTTLLCQMYPTRSMDIITGVETGTPHYELYISCKTETQIKVGTSIKPMLASTHVIDPSKEYSVELKLDGVRLLFKHQGGEYSCWTRSGLFLDPLGVLDILPIRDKLKILKIKGDYVLDGELWVPSHTAGEGFRLVLPIIKSKKKTNIKAYYSVFDLPYYNTDLSSVPLHERRKLLDGLGVRTIPSTKFIHSKLNLLMSKFKNSLYEGVVLKDINSGYEPGKRSMRWIKIKPTPETIDVLVTGAHWGTGKYANHYASFDISVLNEVNGLVSVGQVGSGFTEVELKDLTKRYNQSERLIIEVHAEAWTNTGALRFPRFIRIRGDKDKPNSLEDLKEFMH